MLDGRLAKLEGSVNCIINSQLGAAQLLAEQIQLISNRATQQAIEQRALQPAMEPTARAASPPAYAFINARTVADV
jgi:hypothetical protein